MRDSTFVVLLILGFFGCIALIIAGCTLTNKASCAAHWQGSQYQSRWSLFGDCQISKDGKTWFPEDAYRDMHKDVTIE